MAKAYVVIHCDLGTEMEIIASLKKIKGVREVHGTLGLYDIVVQIESKTGEEIRKIVTENIRKMSKIRSTITLTCSESEEFFQSSEKLIDTMLGQNIVQAYVVIHCDKGEEYPLLKNLNHIPEVKEADVVFGFYDVICKVITTNEKIMETVITKAIRSLPHIVSSMTLKIINEQEI